MDPSDGVEPHEQSAVADLLSDPATHDGASVQRIDTHGAMVFLAGERAWKVKRAVRYPYMDFGTLARRRALCAREVRKNRRTAPSLYLGVAPIIREADGGDLTIGPIDALRDEPDDERNGDGEGARTDGGGPRGSRPAPGGGCAPDPDGDDALAGGRLPRAPDDAEVVEWAVVMERFAQDDVLAERADRGELALDVLRDLAAHVAAYHDESPRCRPPDGGAGSMAQVITENFEELRAAPDVFDPRSVERLASLTEEHLDRVGSLLDQRCADGLVRKCHGDLHLGNVCVLDGGPVLFDAIEFNPALSCIDVLYDVAFLLMDLLHRGMPERASGLFNDYLSRREDLAGLSAMPLFLSTRAAVRAKVSVSMADVQSSESAARRKRSDAARFLGLALDLLSTPEPRLVGIGGLSGTGKSTLARSLAPRLGPAPGAYVPRSDVIRKRTFGVALTERLPEEAYRPSVSSEVYARLIASTRVALDTGYSVIADAVWSGADRAERLRRAAQLADTPFTGLWLTADPDTLLQRVAERSGDASDADESVVRDQLESDIRAPEGWTEIDAGGTPEDTLAAAWSAMEDHR